MRSPVPDLPFSDEGFELLRPLGRPHGGGGPHGLETAVGRDLFHDRAIHGEVAPEELADPLDASLGVLSHLLVQEEEDIGVIPALEPGEEVVEVITEVHFPCQEERERN